MASYYVIKKEKKYLNLRRLRTLTSELVWHAHFTQSNWTKSRVRFYEYWYDVVLNQYDVIWCHWVKKSQRVPHICLVIIAAIWKNHLLHELLNFSCNFWRNIDPAANIFALSMVTQCGDWFAINLSVRVVKNYENVF
jgi:hypothetical protein